MARAIPTPSPSLLTSPVTTISPLFTGSLSLSNSYRAPIWLSCARSSSLSLTRLIDDICSESHVTSPLRAFPALFRDMLMFLTNCPTRAILCDFNDASRLPSLLTLALRDVFSSIYIPGITKFMRFTEFLKSNRRSYVSLSHTYSGSLNIAGISRLNETFAMSLMNF